MFDVAADLDYGFLCHSKGAPRSREDSLKIDILFAEPVGNRRDPLGSHGRQVPRSRRGWDGAARSCCLPLASGLE
jgi:hypothetical protein